MHSTRILAAALLFAAATTAPAAVLYKSVGANGTMEFSDVPPDNRRNVERIRIPDGSSPGAGSPVLASGPSRDEQVRETDDAVARANAQLDIAEHALAEARRTVAGEHADALRMVSTRISRADEDRLAFYKKDVLLARQALLEVLKEKRKAAMPPTVTASNEWTAFIPGSRR